MCNANHVPRTVPNNVIPDRFTLFRTLTLFESWNNVIPRITLFVTMTIYVNHRIYVNGRNRSYSVHIVKEVRETSFVAGIGFFSDIIICLRVYSFLLEVTPSLNFTFSSSRLIMWPPVEDIIIFCIK